jgi:hypothetical protein
MGKREAGRYEDTLAPSLDIIPFPCTDSIFKKTTRQGLSLECFFIVDGYLCSMVL